MGSERALARCAEGTLCNVSNALFVLFAYIKTVWVIYVFLRNLRGLRAWTNFWTGFVIFAMHIQVRRGWYAARGAPSQIEPATLVTSPSGPYMTRTDF